MNRRNSLILFTGLGMVVVITVIAVLANWRLEFRSAERAEADSLALERRAEAEQLTAELRRKDDHIAELQAEIQRLNRRLDDLSASRSEPARSPVVAAEEPVRAPHARFSTISEATAQRLRELLPDKFANHTAEELAMLTELDLGGVELTEADLQQLAELTHLRRLSLRGALIADDVLSLLGDQLEFLDLRGSNVTGAGLHHLSGNSLQALSLTNTAVTASDLYLLPPMPYLQTLKLNSIELDEVAIETVGSYHSVRHLEVDSTGLTDAGLRRLLQLNPQLTRIELRGTKVTEAGLEQLRADYPDCQLVSDSDLPYSLFR